MSETRAALPEELISAARNQRLRDYTTTITILEHLSDAIFILDPGGEIEYANKVALDMLGLELKDLIGSNLDHFLMSDIDFGHISQSNSNSYLIENIYRGVFNELETSLVNGDYTTPVVISFGLVRNRRGEVNYLIASAKDITIRKQLEREMEQRQLLALSRDRYKELGELAVNMVHNLSQPVTTIRLSIELLQKQLKVGKLDADKTGRALQKIVLMLDAITASITNVRNFAFLTEDESLKPLQINEVLSGALRQLAYDLNERNMKVDVNSSGKLPHIMANPINIQQVFVTLIKYLAQELQNDSAVGGKRRNPYAKITIIVKNIRNRWLQISIGGGRINNKPTADSGSRNADPIVINDDLELTVVQMIITSIGGDFKAQQTSAGYPGFVLRIPVDLQQERDQLLNLIELMNS